MNQSGSQPCLFCNLPPERIIMANKLAMAIRDGFPVSPGHTLIMPKRHVSTLFNTTTEERLSMFELMDKAKIALDAEMHPAEQ